MLLSGDSDLLPCLERASLSGVSCDRPNRAKCRLPRKSAKPVKSSKPTGLHTPRPCTPHTWGCGRVWLPKALEVPDHVGVAPCVDVSVGVGGVGGVDGVEQRPVDFER